MEYLSTTEVAKLWKLSPRRVSILASQGKIPGVKKVANSWLIPFDAKKPLDARFSSNKEIENHDAHFRFPLFIYSVSERSSMQNTLYNDEKLLFKYEKIFYSNRMNVSYPLFEELYKNTSNNYIKLSCLYYLAFTDMLNQNFDKYEYYYGLLKEGISKYSKRFSALSFMLLDIDIIRKGNVEFNLNINYKDYEFDVSAFSYLASVEYYKNVFDLLSGEGNKNLSLYEFMCFRFEKEEYYFVAQQMHLYMALMCLLTKKNKKLEEHVTSALEIAHKHDLYSVPSELYNYLQEPMDKIAIKFPSEVIEKIREGNNLFINSINAVAKHYSNYDVKVLKQTDYKYILYALRGTPNKVIAINLGVSESRISEKYSQLCKKLNVLDKKDLIEKMKQNMGNPYLLGEN